MLGRPAAGAVWPEMIGPPRARGAAARIAPMLFVPMLFVSGLFVSIVSRFLVPNVAAPDLRLSCAATGTCVRVAAQSVLAPFQRFDDGRLCQHDASIRHVFDTQEQILCFARC